MVSMSAPRLRPQVTPPCDRRNNTTSGLQAGFLERFGVPLFRAAARLMPGLAPLADQVADRLGARGDAGPLSCNPASAGRLDADA